MEIKLKDIDDVNVFSKTCSNIYEDDIYVSQGKQIINAKSLLGLFSLDLSKEIDVKIDTTNENVKSDFYNYLKKWKVEE